MRFIKRKMLQKATGLLSLAHTGNGMTALKIGYTLTASSGFVSTPTNWHCTEFAERAEREREKEREREREKKTGLGLLPALHNFSINFCHILREMDWI
jgi:hypothetical protein